MNEKLVNLVIETLKEWAREQKTDVFTDFYLFGSLLKGRQFLVGTSDIDLVVILSDYLTDSFDRAKVCKELRTSKFHLEIKLLQVLQRKDASIPITSLVVVTSNEFIWDIHKSRVTRFFRDNYFLSLLDKNTTVQPIGIDNRDILSRLIQSIEITQEYRNKYLSISSNGSLLVREYSGDDVLPKDLARSSAQISYFENASKNEDEFDINEGTFYLINLLYKKAQQGSNNEWFQLKQKIFERSYRSTQPPTLTDCDLLLLHELLFDKAYELLSQTYPELCSPPQEQSKHELFSNTVPAQNTSQGTSLSDIAFLDDMQSSPSSSNPYSNVSAENIRLAIRRVYTMVRDFKVGISDFNEWLERTRNQRVHISVEQLPRELLENATVHDVIDQLRNQERLEDFVEWFIVKYPGLKNDLLT